VSEPQLRVEKLSTERADPRLRALSEFTSGLVRQRGRANQLELNDFRAAGFSHPQVLQIILAISVKP